MDTSELRGLAVLCPMEAQVRRCLPFRVYFGRRTEVYVDQSCRGVEAGSVKPKEDSVKPKAEGAEQAFKTQVLDKSHPEALLEHDRLARKEHTDFRKQAEAADVWGEVNVAIQAAVAHPWFEQAPSPERWAAALAPFAQEKVAQRPFYLDADLRWLTFQREGSRLEVLEMHQDGSLAPEGTEVRPEPRPPPAEAIEGLAALLRRLAARDVMAGQVFAIVAASRYRLTVERAARQRVAQVAADLAVRVQVLQALGIAGQDLVQEADRFYDSSFLDAPTIGGWL